MAVPLNAEFTIAAIVEAMLPRGSDDGTALYIHVDMRAHYYSDDKPEMAEHRDIHLIFARPNNYTKVWSAVTTSMHRPKPNEFTLRSDHDSCWREDGLREIHSSYVAIRRALADRGADWDKISDFNNIRIQRLKIAYDRLDRKHPLAEITEASGLLS